jgi:phage terminase large subunit-like protein
MSKPSRRRQPAQPKLDSLDDFSEWMRAERSPIERLMLYVPTGPLLKIHRSPRRRRVCLGGNRGGKTVGGAVETVSRATGIVPPFLEKLGGFGGGPLADLDDPEPMEFWVSSVDFEVSKSVAEQMVRKFLPQDLIAGEDKEHRVIHLKTKVSIGFRSAESGRTKYQGRMIDWIWWDEEQGKSIYDECMARLVDRQGWFFFTMTPLMGFTWSYPELYERQSDPVVDVEFVEAPTDSNFYLPKSAIAEFRAGLERDPELLATRFYGRYTLFSARSPFGEACLRLVKDGIIEGRKTGPLTRYVNPEKGKSYVIGGDVAEGLGQDQAVATVLCRETGEQVAEWASRRMEPEVMAREIYGMAEDYNTALVVIERNNHGWAVLNELTNLGYANLYKQTSYDSRSKKRTARLGFFTSTRSKVLAIDVLARALRDGSLLVHSAETFKELTTFIQDEDGLHAIEGCRDDRVMATAMAAVGMMDTGFAASPIETKTGWARGETWNDCVKKIDDRFTVRDRTRWLR